MTTRTKIKVAIAGAGMVSQHHLRAWARLDQVEVVAICDHHKKRAETRAAEFGIPGTYDDVAAMLDNEMPGSRIRHLKPTASTIFKPCSWWKKLIV